MIVLETRDIPASAHKPARIAVTALGHQLSRKYYSASPGGADISHRQAAQKYLNDVLSNHTVTGGAKAGGTGHYFAEKSEPAPEGIQVLGIDLADNMDWGKVQDKETIHADRLYCIHDGRVQVAASVTCYMGRSRNATKVYAVAQFYSPDPAARTWGCGVGSAGGYGYCKSSAAAAEAIQNAGVRLDKNLGGTGMDQVHKAMRAYAHAAGWPMVGHYLG